MISALKRWLGQRANAGDTSDSVTSASAPQRPVEYRAELVPALHREHRQLLAMFAQLEHACEHDNDDACRAKLAKFNQLLRDHLLTENRHLYGYFARHTDPDPRVAQRIASMSTEMLRIGKSLHHFISTYARGTWSVQLRHQFREDIRNIGAILSHRIHEEEHVLYPLYRPYP